MHSYQKWKTPCHLLGVYNSSDGSGPEIDKNNNYEDPYTDETKNRKLESISQESTSELSAAQSDELRVDDTRDFINNLAQHVIYGYYNYILLHGNFFLLPKY